MRLWVVRIQFCITSNFNLRWYFLGIPGEFLYCIYCFYKLCTGGVARTVDVVDRFL
jgi:hypothetical protein